MTLPPELKTAEKDIVDLQMKFNKDYPTFWIPSEVVVVEWEKRENEFASFFETARKELRKSLCVCDTAPDLPCHVCRRIATVFGGEEKELKVEMMKND